MGKSDRSKMIATSAAAQSTPAAAPIGGFLAVSQVDPELDDIFSKSAAYAIPPPAPIVPAASTKHKVSSTAAVPSPTIGGDKSTAPLPPKKRKREGESETKKVKKPKKGKKVAIVEPEAEEDVEELAEDEKDEDALVDEAIAELEADADEEAEGELEDGEDEDMDKDEGEEEEDESEEDGEEDEDVPVSDEAPDAEELVHESLRPTASTSATKDSKDSSSSKTKKEKHPKIEKYTPPSESPLDRDRRSIFIGNAPHTLLTSKPLLSAFKRHILSFVPNAKIESVRFRSIAFSNPTAELPIGDEKDTPAEEEEKKERRRLEREKERAKSWREEEKRVREEMAENGGGGRGKRDRDRDEEEIKDMGKDEKVFQLPAEKRKVAFIKKQFHTEVTTVNAYIVFAHSPPNRSLNVPPILSPYTAAANCILLGHNSVFSGHTLRIDSVQPSLQTITSSAKEEGKSTLPAKREAWAKGRDTKASLFVGNLDFATKEEDLRVFFEELVKAERGEAVMKEESGGSWVVDVRIIRDKDTQLGKGFGYVNFQDRESVDEVLALPTEKLKFAKRNLRVQACKTLPAALGGPKEKVAATKPTAAASSSSAKPGFKKPIVKSTTPIGKIPKVPKGDPLLGERLAGMSKDERKEAKASDADRLARRAAKKQAVVIKAHAANSREKVKLDVKGQKGAPKIKAKQSRVRSSNALKKMKGRAD